MDNAPFAAEVPVDVRSQCLSPNGRVLTRAAAFCGRLGPGLLLAVAMGVAGLWLAERPWLAEWHVSALTLAIVFGMAVGNAFGMALPAPLVPGVIFSQQKLLRLGVILYGLRVTFQDIAAVGAAGLMIDLVIVCGRC